VSDDNLSRKVIENERTKLLANALDRASTACFTVGIATPIAGYLYNVSNFRMNVRVIELGGGFAVWLLAVVALHYLGRRALKGLKQ